MMLTSSTLGKLKGSAGFDGVMTDGSSEAEVALFCVRNASTSSASKRPRPAGTYLLCRQLSTLDHALHGRVAHPEPSGGLFQGEFAASLPFAG